MKSTILIIKIFFSLLVFFSLVGCTSDDEDPNRFGLHDESGRGYKLDHYINSKTPIEIAVVWQSDKNAPNFTKGAAMAADEINSLDGSIFPKININFIDSAPFLKASKFSRRSEGRYRNAPQIAASKIADVIIDNPEIVAVIGHKKTSKTADDALIHYQENGILFLSSTDSSRRFIQLDAPLGFQLFPGINQIADQVSRFGKTAGISRLIIVHEHSIREQEDPIPIFRKELSKQGIHSEVLSFKPSTTQSRAVILDKISENLVVKLESAAADVGIMLLVESDLAAMIFSRMQLLKMKPPILSVAGSNRMVKTSPEGLVFLDVFSPDSSYHAMRFREKYKAKFNGEEPNTLTALGYDHVYLYYKAILCAGDTTPASVALTMRYQFPGYYGATGGFTFLNSYVNTSAALLFRQIIRKNGKKAIITLDL